jgi:hypothetical protein
MSTVGGHLVHMLVSVLKEQKAMVFFGQTVEPVPMNATIWQLAWNATVDPSALVALLKATTPLLVDATSEDGSIVLCYHVCADLGHRTVDMPEARRVLLGLLTSDDHLKILQGDK